jgi:glycosyltransferase involved in cell wall biosynthesis
MSDAPKRVLHVMRMRGVSGAENHLFELTRALREEGWDSDVLIPSPYPPKLTEFAERLAIACGYVDIIPMKTDISPRLLYRLIQVLRTRRYDIAHAHMVHADWYLAAASLIARGVPLVTSKHNPDAFRSLAVFRIGERLSLRRYAAVIAISEHLRRFTENTTGLEAVTVPYGLPTSNQSMRRRDRGTGSWRLLTVARLEKQKGIEVTIEAMLRVSAAAPGAHLAIAGDGKQRGMLGDRIAELGLGKTVSLLGPRDDVEELMNGAHMLVHHARWEGFGLVLLEAMRAGLPIVATRVSAIPEVIADGETGILVPPDDPESLATAIIELIRDPGRRQSMGIAGQEKLREDFSPEKMGRGTAAVYESVLARDHARRARTDDQAGGFT